MAMRMMISMTLFENLNTAQEFHDTCTYMF